MSIRLDKAKAAVEALKELDLDTPGDHGVIPAAIHDQFVRLCRSAEVHSAIAQAEATERILSVLERRTGHL